MQAAASTTVTLVKSPKSVCYHRPRRHGAVHDACGFQCLTLYILKLLYTANYSTYTVYLGKIVNTNGYFKQTPKHKLDQYQTGVLHGEKCHL